MLGTTSDKIKMNIAIKEVGELACSPATPATAATASPSATVLPTAAARAAATAAHHQAVRQWNANLRALNFAQPQLAASLSLMPDQVEWVFARDGALSARQSDQWLAGCSLPARAAQQMLSRLSLDGVVACMLAPAHAQQIHAALDRLAAAQAIIAVIPEIDDLRMALACGDFADDIQRHRLWLVAGGAWETQLESLLAEQPGLPTPTQFIRPTTVGEDVAQRIIGAAERIFSQATAQRACQSADWVARQTTRKTPAIRDAKPSASRLLVVAPSHFRLWNNSGSSLAAILAGRFAGHDAVRLDVDDPAQASGLMLAKSAADCDALVTANLPRASFGAVVAAAMPIITWQTTPAIPAYSGDYPGDALLVADAAWLPVARAAGWPASRLAVAAWPTSPHAPVPIGALALIADTSGLQTPKSKLRLSSHHLLWEFIRDELLDNPFALGTNLDGYLAERRRKLGISPEGFDAAMFAGQLILPAYQQGLARRILAAGLPLRLWGNGWNELPELSSAWAGPAASAEQFAAAVAASSALVHPLPQHYAHEVDSLNRSVLRPDGRNWTPWISRTRQILAAPSCPAADSQPLAEATILRLLDVPLGPRC